MFYSLIYLFISETFVYSWTRAVSPFGTNVSVELAALGRNRGPSVPQTFCLYDTDSGNDVEIVHSVKTIIHFFNSINKHDEAECFVSLKYQFKQCRYTERTSCRRSVTLGVTRSGEPNLQYENMSFIHYKITSGSK